MVYGGMVVSSSLYDVSECTKQLAAFKLNYGLRCSERQEWWLRAVAHSGAFALAYSGGYAYDRKASDAYGVRPYFLLK
jgi:hypothetical protein